MTAPAAAPAEAPERVWVILNVADYPMDVCGNRLFAEHSAANHWDRKDYDRAPHRVVAYVPESALAAERERCRRLREALAEYGEHLSGCLFNHDSCTCGYDELLAEGGGNDANAG